jgi:hypothetical protein
VDIGKDIEIIGFVEGSYSTYDVSIPQYQLEVFKKSIYLTED